MDESPLARKTFEIITTAGTSKSLLMEALAFAKEGNLISAEKLCKEAEDLLLQSHRLHTALMQAEATGARHDIDLMTVHAQDHLMSTMLLKDMIVYIIELYRRTTP